MILVIIIVVLIAVVIPEKLYEASMGAYKFFFVLWKRGQEVGGGEKVGLIKESGL